MSNESLLVLLLRNIREQFFKSILTSPFFTSLTFIVVFSAAGGGAAAPTAITINSSGGCSQY